jgi:DNA-directed RNA polymerase specialized sigma24 family protein
MKGKVNEVAAASKSPESPDPVSSDKALSAMLAMLVADREESIASKDGNARKTELILAASGLNAAEIAPIVGKSYDAVRQTLLRGKGK